MAHRRPLLSVSVFACILGFALLTPWPAAALDTSFTVASGDWFTPANWDRGVPIATNRALIYNSGAATLNAAGGRVDHVYMGSGVNSGSLTIGPAGELKMYRNMVVGYSGRGYLYLNGGSVTQTNADQYLYAGYGVTSTGTVVQSGGVVDVGYLSVGDSGNGTYTQNGGTIILRGSATVEQRIGRFAGSVGTFTQNAGLLNDQTRQFRFGDAGRAYVYLNGGTTLVAQSYAIVGHSGNSTVNINGGNLLVTNSYIYVGYSVGSTGSVIQTAGRVQSKSHLYHGYSGNAYYTLNGGELSIGGGAMIGYGVSGNPANGYFTLGGGTCTVFGVGAVNECSIGTYPSAHGFLEITNGLMILTNGIPSLIVGKEGNGTLTMSGGRLDLSRYFYCGQVITSTGTVVQTGGRINMKNSTYLGYRGTASSYTMSGGWLCLASNVLDYWGGSTIPSTGELVFRQSGGTVYKPFYRVTDDRDLMLGANAASRCLYEISGGSLIASNVLVRLYGSNSVWRIIGSAPVIRIARFYHNNHANAVLDFVLDKSTNHISTIYGSSTAGRLSGTLGIGIQGGIVLARTNAFTLVDQAAVGSYDFGIKPPTEMWSCAWLNDQLPANHDLYRATLATGGGSWYQGTIDMDGVDHLNFAARNVGSIKVDHIDTNDVYWGVNVHLDVNPGSHTLTDLVTYMRDSGYTNIVQQGTAPYDIRISIPAADTKHAFTGGPSWFLWDLSRFDAAATVSGLLAYENRPQGTSIMIR